MTYSWETPSAPRFSWENQQPIFHSDAPSGFHLPTGDEAAAFGYGAADAASLGFGDEGVGALAGIGAVLQGRDYGEAYRQRVQEARERLERARAEHPISTMAGSIAGVGATLLVPGAGEAAAGRLGLTGLREAAAVGRGLVSGEALPFGRALTQAASEGGTFARSARALGAQAALGGAQGAIYGGIYGAGAANEEDRLEGARTGALMGGALGAVSPAAFQLLGRTGRAVYGNPLLRTAAGGGIGSAIGYTQGDTEAERQQNALRGAAFGAGLGAFARPVLSAARQAFRNPIAAYGNQTGMSLGLPMGQGGSPPAPEIRSSVVKGIDRLLGRQGRSVSDLETGIAAAEAEPLGRTLADVGGEQFLSKADALAQLPGQTGPRAASIAEERARNLPTQITDELQTRLGVAQSPTEALQSLRDQYTQVSRDLYQPLLKQDVSPEAMRARLQPIINRLPKSVRDRAERVTSELAAMDGLRPEQLTGAQRIHYMKMALDDAIMGVQQAEGLGSAQRAGLQRLKGEFLSAIEGDAEQGIEPLIPNYREARQQWGGLKDAEDAMEAGRKAINMRPQEVRATMAGMTPFEKQHFRIAAADELIRKIQRGSAAVGQRNAANALNSNEIQGVVREIFDNPQEAEAFLRRLNERNQLLRNASAWIGNSATARRAAQAGDQFMASLAEAGINAPLNPAGAAGQVGRAGLNVLRGMGSEAENNALGNALLRNIEGANPEDKAFMQALLARLRQLERERIGRAQSAGAGGATGAVGGGSYTDQGYY